MRDRSNASKSRQLSNNLQHRVRSDASGVGSDWVRGGEWPAGDATRLCKSQGDQYQSEPHR
jgi:hypothetical protein